jgi:hypothetical protein
MSQNQRPSFHTIFEGHYLKKPLPEVERIERKSNQRLVRRFLKSRPTKEFFLNETDMEQPRNMMVIGRKNSGKSALLETMAESYLDYGQKVIDLWGATDSESLAWLRSKYVAKNPEKVLLLHDPSYELQFDGKSYDTMPVTEVKFDKAEEYDIMLTSPRFFDLMNWERRYEEMAAFIMQLWIYRQSWKRIINVICREASELLYSRLTMNETQIDTKSRAIYMLQESRHSGISWSLDTLRPTNIDAAVREGVLDYIVFKALNWAGLPDDLHFMYRFFDSMGMAQMDKDQFVLLCADGGLAEGLNYLPEWHKTEQQNLQIEFGIRPEKKKDAPVEGKQIGERFTIGDKEHARMVELRLGQMHLSLGRIRGLMRGEGYPSRSGNAVVIGEIDKHMESVAKSSFCEKCERVNSPFARIAEEGPK